MIQNRINSSKTTDRQNQNQSTFKKDFKNILKAATEKLHITYKEIMI